MSESVETLRARHRYRIDVVDGAAWEVLEIAGEGVPVVFLAGGQGTAEVFFKPMLRLEGRLPMLGVHYPPEADARRLAVGLATLLDRLGIDRLSIVGSSFGAYLAQFFAAAHPNRIEQLVLGNAFVDAEAVKHLPIFDKAELETYAPHTFKAERLASIEASPDGEFKEVMRDQVGARQSAASVYARMMGVAISTPAPATGVAAERIAVIDCEDDSVIAPEMKATVARRFEGADIRVLERGGHFPHILNPDAYVAVLEERLCRPAEQAR